MTMSLADRIAKMKAKKEEAMQGGNWFLTCEENIGTTIVGQVRKMFTFKREKQDKLSHAIQLELLEGVSLHQYVDEDSKEKVPVLYPVGEQIVVELTGQLKWVVDDIGLQVGDLFLLEYLGKDLEVKLNGNHPHKWAFSHEKVSQEIPQPIAQEQEAEEVAE